MQSAGDTKVPLPFKIFGLQRTCTNLLQVLTTRNFRVKYLEEKTTGWKHGPPSRVCYADAGLPTRFILCVKNPYAWLVSCYRYFRKAYAHDRTMPADFVADPTMSFDEFVSGRSYEFANPVQRWNFAYRCWLSTLPEAHTVVVRQEEMLGAEMQVRLLVNLARKLGFQQTSDELNVTNIQIDVDAAVQGEVDRFRYATRQYMTEFSPPLLEMVNNTLDWDLMNNFGYAREDRALVRRQMKDLRLWVRGGTSDGREAWRTLGDPYGLEVIRGQFSDLAGMIDIGAHIGQTALLVHRLWPQCPVVSYEPCVENFRMLRLNVADIPHVRCELAAVTGGASDRAWFSAGDPSVETAAGTVGADGDQSVTAVDLASATGRLEKVDLVKFGCPRAAMRILSSPQNRSSAANVLWIVGRLPDGEAERAELVAMLDATHRVSARETPFGHYFSAQRRGSA